MKKLGIFLVIVLTLILTIPNISFAQQFVDSEHFGTYRSRSYYGHRGGDERYYERHERHEWHPYSYGHYGYTYPYDYEPGPLYYGPSVDLNFGFVFR